MLRASSRGTDRDADLRSVVHPGTDPLLAHGGELLAFTDAAVLGDADEMPVARRDLLRSAGEAAVVRAAAVAGNFQMMNRLLDTLGVPVSGAALTLADELGIEVPRHLRTHPP